jgi:hypothetical protein
MVSGEVYSSQFFFKFLDIGKPVDMWSFGVILYILLGGKVSLKRLSEYNIEYQAILHFMMITNARYSGKL